MRLPKVQSSPQEKPILIGVMGVTGAGKSNFIKTVTGDQKIIVSRRLKSCTQEVQAATLIKIGGRLVQLVDTPGFSDTKLTDTVVLGMIADWMKQSFDDGQKLHGIVFLHRITDTRVDGGSARSLNLFGNICGADFLKNTVMVTTMWDKRRDPEDLGESEDVERDLLSEHWSHFLKVDTGTEGVPVVESIGGAEVVELAEDARSDGSAMYARSYNNKQNCEEIIRRIVAQAPGIPVLQKEVGEEGKGIGETEAGKELDRELAILQEEHLKAIDELGKLHEEALKASETRTAAMLEEEKKLREEQMAISERDRIELSKRVEGEERERKKMEAELKEQQKKQEKERRETKEKFEKQEKEQREMNEKQEKERREMREKLEKQEEERREMKEKLEEQAKDQQRLQERLEEQGRKAREPQPGRGPLGLLGGVLDDVAKIMFQPLIAGPAVNPILDTSGSYRRFLGI